ncbi:MAG: hypothetical protein ACLFQ6_01290 [Candidatus Sumerlaeia bacterium]
MSNYNKLFIPFILVGMLLSGFYGCSGDSQETPIDNDNSGTTSGKSPAKIAPYRADLIEMAFEIASAIPLKPHVKDRSLSQEKVFEASMELGLIDRAKDFAEGIDNWRKGVCYGELAVYYAEREQNEKAQEYLNQAEKQIMNATEEWRQDRIRNRIAKTLSILGKDEEAEAFSTDLVDSETGKLHGYHAAQADVSDFEKHIQTLDELIAQDNFDIMRNALEAYANLYDRFYSDTERRALVEEKIKASWSKLPFMLRIQLMADLGNTALSHGDSQKAMEMVKSAQALLDEKQWTAEHKIPLMSRVATLRFHAGDADGARDQLDDAMARFQADREKIANVFRAETLLPVIEAYADIDDRAAAIAIAKRTVEEAVENPNSRPRAEDLSAICVALARSSIEPDAVLMDRLQELQRGLGQPW